MGDLGVPPFEETSMAICMGEMRKIHRKWGEDPIFKLSGVETLESVIFGAYDRICQRSGWKWKFLCCMMLYVNFPRCIMYAVGIHRQWQERRCLPRRICTNCFFCSCPCSSSPLPCSMMVGWTRIWDIKQLNIRFHWDNSTMLAILHHNDCWFCAYV